jgi:hypothetical protein
LKQITNFKDLKFIILLGVLWICYNYLMIYSERHLNLNATRLSRNITSLIFYLCSAILILIFMNLEFSKKLFSYTKFFFLGFTVILLLIGIVDYFTASRNSSIILLKKILASIRDTIISPLPIIILVVLKKQKLL